MNAEHRGDDRHDDKGNQPQRHAVGTEKPGTQQYAGNDGHQVHQVSARQGQGFAVDAAIQFAAGHQRPGEGHGADKDTDKHFHQLDGVFGTRGGYQGLDIA